MSAYLIPMGSMTKKTVKIRRRPFSETNHRNFLDPKTFNRFSLFEF